MLYLGQISIETETDSCDDNIFNASGQPVMCTLQKHKSGQSCVKSIFSLA